MPKLPASGGGVIATTADDKHAAGAGNIVRATKEGANAIITVHGAANEMCDVIGTAISNGISVISFDFDQACSENQIMTSQHDGQMAELLLEQAFKYAGPNVNVGYVNDINFTPWIKRDKVWQKYKHQHDWHEVFFVNEAAEYQSPEDLQAAILDAIESSPDDLAFVYAPWDYLMTTTVKALEDASSDAKAYGADITDEGILTMTTPSSSPWLATAGGDAGTIGASVMRMAALAMAGELDPWVSNIAVIKIPSTLITQDVLLDEDAKNTNQLLEVLP
jgi:ABC-type sugar transport system substrate-binding protein